jgi:alkaline phosphatase D
MCKIQGNQLLPSPRTLLVELDDIILKRISQSDISGISASVMRITRHLSELDEMQVQEYFQMVPKIAGNLLEIGRVIPRDSFFSIIRHLVNQIEGKRSEACPLRKPARRARDGSRCHEIPTGEP